MKITIEKDDGTKLMFEGPSALDDLRDYLGPPPLRIPWDPPNVTAPHFPPLVIGDPLPWFPQCPYKLPFGTYC